MNHFFGAGFYYIIKAGRLYTLFLRKTRHAREILLDQGNLRPVSYTDRNRAGGVAVIMDRGNHVPVHYVDTVDLVHAVGSVHILLVAAAGRDSDNQATKYLTITRRCATFQKIVTRRLNV
ncbi:MAG: hypothetical protein A2Z46_05120 [Nitrospirae bacterium RBG_19FT_COMBO_55_12]|nr:MAG: hypothetical protein A2Z46_05120 [Nitrospirae bacterium RBG_19FT_COMBO_55_12]